TVGTTLQRRVTARRSRMIAASAAAALVVAAAGADRAVGSSDPAAPPFLPYVIYDGPVEEVAIADVTGDGIPDVLAIGTTGGDADYLDRVGKLFVFPGTGSGALG